MSRTLALPLRGLACGYLALPLGLFLGGWLRPVWAFPFLALLAATAFAMRRELAARVEVSRSLLAVAAVVAIAATALSGVAGLGHRNPDWAKHDAVLRGVVEHDWPVFYDGPVPGLGGDRHGLVFYAAYYLPAGAVGKLAGGDAAQVALAVWTAIGLFLTLVAFARLLPERARPVAAGLFLLASGLDGVGVLLRGGAGFAFDEHIEWWSGLWQYSSNVSLLFWVPHQALGGWLVSALLLDGLERGEGARTAPVDLSLALFWSPFAALGALPLALVSTLRSRREAARFWPNWVAAPALGALFVVYYAALRQTRLPASLDRELLSSRLPTLLLFLLLEGLLVLALAWPRREPRPAERAIAVVVGLELLVVPLFRFGLYNDFAMRVSIPPLFALWVLAGRTLERRDPGASARARRLALATALLLGIATPSTEIARCVARYRAELPELARTPELPHVHVDRRLAHQYLGPPGALFFRYLADRP